MSRIGRIPVEIPPKVKVEIAGGQVRVEGPKGKLALPVSPLVGVAVKEGKVLVERKGNSKGARAMHGTTRAHIANMVKGVLTPFEKTLEISGAGFGAKVAGRVLSLTLGFTHPVDIPIPEGLEVEAPAPVTVTVRGPNRQQVGQFSAELRALRPQDPYKQKGVRYRDEVIKKKAGKAAVGVAK